MPREGTKTQSSNFNILDIRIEIRYAPGGDENRTDPIQNVQSINIEIRYAPGGDENILYNENGNVILALRLDMPREGTKTLFAYAYIMRVFIEIRYAPGGDENR